jgi:hypothetical protein
MLYKIGIWAAVVCLAIVAIAAAYVARDSLLRSQAAVMGKYATSAVCEYVAEHDGDWPSQWSDLEPHMPDQFSVESIAKIIAIDFHADPKRLARQSVDQFTAIRPAGCYGASYWDLKEYWGVPRLLELLDRQNAEQTGIPELSDRGRPMPGDAGE